MCGGGGGGRRWWGGGGGSRTEKNTPADGAGVSPTIIISVILAAYRPRRSSQVLHALDADHARHSHGHGHGHSGPSCRDCTVRSHLPRYSPVTLKNTENGLAPGAPSLIRLMVSVDVKQHWALVRAQELCESRDGRPGLSVPDSPYGLCGRKATLSSGQSSGTVWKSRWPSWALRPRQSLWSLWT